MRRHKLFENYSISVICELTATTIQCFGQGLSRTKKLSLPASSKQLIAVVTAKAKSTDCMIDAIAIVVRNLRKSDLRIHAFACDTWLW